jgi:hypothetical protein
MTTATDFLPGDTVKHNDTIGTVESIVEIEEGAFELYVNVAGAPGYFPADETEKLA